MNDKGRQSGEIRGKRENDLPPGVSSWLERPDKIWLVAGEIYNSLVGIALDADVGDDKHDCRQRINNTRGAMM